MDRELVRNFDDIIKCLNIALKNIDNNGTNIELEIKKWKFKITLSELKESLNIILRYISKWYEDYKKTNDILCIDLKEYDIVSKESSYVLGETSLVDDIHSEEIDFIIGKIGVLLQDKIIGENFNVGTPTKENIKYAFKKLYFYLKGCSNLEDYKEYREKFYKILKEVETISSIYNKTKKLFNIEDKILQDIKFDLIDLVDETRLIKSYYAEWSLQWAEAIISLKMSESNMEVNNG